MRRRVELLPDEFGNVRADLGDPGSISAGLESAGLELGGVGAIDALVFTVTADERTEQAYVRTYVEGLRAVLAAANPAKIVVVSSTAVYHQNDGQWVDEASPTQPAGFNGQAMLAMETVAADHRAPSTAVRLAGVYGPGRDRLINQVRAGEAAFGPDPTYTNRIHVDDAAALIAHAATNDVPPLVIGVDDDPAERADVVRWLASQLEVEVPPVSSNPRSGANKRCRNTVARSGGWAPAYPSFRDGYLELLADQ